MAALLGAGRLGQPRLRAQHATETFSSQSKSTATGVSLQRRFEPISSPGRATFTIQAAIERDFNSLWNTGYFEDIRFEREATPKGWILHVYVKEKPRIKEINYLGINAISKSDILDRFKEAKVGISVESQYDPTKVKKAEVTIKQLEAEHGHQFATVRTEVRPIPPASVGMYLRGAGRAQRSKSDKSSLKATRHVSSRVLRHSMHFLKPIGIPHSIFLENIFAKTYDASKLDDDMELVREAFQNRGYFKAVVGEPQTKIRDTGHAGFHIPLIQHGPGKSMDITIPDRRGRPLHAWAASPSRATRRSEQQGLAQSFPH